MSKISRTLLIINHMISCVSVPIFFLMIFLTSSSCSKSMIEGDVVDSNGNGIEGVLVQIENNAISVLTDSLGQYSVNYTPGSLSIIFSKDEFITNKMDLNIEDATVFNAETTILHKSKIVGNVVDLRGNGIEGVLVKIENNDISVLTDSLGQYSINYTPGSLSIIFSKDEFITNKMDLNIEDAIVFNAEITVLHYSKQYEESLFGAFKSGLMMYAMIKIMNTGSRIFPSADEIEKSDNFLLNLDQNPDGWKIENSGNLTDNIVKLTFVGSYPTITYIYKCPIENDHSKYTLEKIK